MKLRKLAALALAAVLLLSCAAPALAQSTADFVKQMKKLDTYLRTYADAPDVGDNAMLYLMNHKDMRGLSAERLEFVLRVYLGCTARVPMRTRLDAYARDISNGYPSISDLCAQGYTPEQAAEAGRFERRAAAAGMTKIPAPKGYVEPKPPAPPYCCP